MIQSWFVGMRTLRFRRAARSTAKENQPGGGRTHPPGWSRSPRNGANRPARERDGLDAPKSGRDALSRCRFGGGRNRCDRLQDLGGDLVGVALRIRTAVFEIALVPVIDEAVRHADRGATVRDAVAELMDRSGLVL